MSFVDLNWSWDNRYLGVTTRQGEGGRLIVVDVSDGSYRELVRSDSDWFWSVRFSPDGRFVAYEATPAKSNDGRKRLYVVSSRGGEPLLAKEVPSNSHALMDWTADGHYLITKEVQQGKSALYLLPMKDGVAAGPNKFVRFGDFDDAHTTLSGTLVYQDHSATLTNVGAFLASMDSNGHIGRWRDLDLRGGGVDNSPWPSFSSEGNQIAYVARLDAESEQTDLIILDLPTSQQRVLYHSSDGALTCHFSSKEPKVFCALTGRQGGTKTDLFSVDTKTGAVENISSLQGSKYMNSCSDDGKTIYLFDGKAATRWSLDTQQETVITILAEYSRMFELPSFDGRWLLRSVSGDSLSVRPISGGDWRTLVSGVKSLDSCTCTTHDGNWVFYSANDSTGKPALFRVPTTGGAPDRVGELPDVPYRFLFNFSVDGHQILATSWGRQNYDLWVLENFEPPAKK